MNKILQVLLWNALSMCSFFSGALIRTKGKIFSEVGDVIKTSEVKDGYVVIDVREWVERNTKSHLSAWSLGKNICNKLHVEDVEISIRPCLIGKSLSLVVTFNVPGIGQCEMRRE